MIRITIALDEDHKKDSFLVDGEQVSQREIGLCLAQLERAKYKLLKILDEDFGDDDTYLNTGIDRRNTREGRDGAKRRAFASDE